MIPLASSRSAHIVALSGLLEEAQALNQEPHPVRGETCDLPRSGTVTELSTLLGKLVMDFLSVSGQELHRTPFQPRASWPW